MTLPDFIGIGAQKAGTTWLYDMLVQNPSIWLPPLKEVHYFDNIGADDAKKRKRSEHLLKVADRLESGKEIKGSTGSGRANAEFLRELAQRGDLMEESWYRSIFGHPDAAGRVTGEITPAYLALGKERIEAVAEMLPETKFILVVREPHIRNLSQIKMAVGRSKTETPTREDWEAFLGRIRKNVRGDYATAIPMWQSHFGPERLLILPFSIIRTDPGAMLRRIEDFIGAERFADYKALTEPVHQTKSVTVPEWVDRELAEMAKPQSEYLIGAFGEDFYIETR